MKGVVACVPVYASLKFSCGGCLFDPSTPIVMIVNAESSLIDFK
jgi:hypothetical protein